MKGKSLSILGIIAAVIGAIFIIFNSAITIMGLTMACGALFVLVGLACLIFFNSIKDERYSAKAMTLISNAASIVLGVSMLVFAGTFIKLIAFMLGLLVGVCAIWQFFVLAVGTRPYQLPVWLYVFPIALVGGAIYIYIIKDSATDNVLLLATGISAAVLGASCIIEGSALGMARREEKKNKLAEPKADEADSLPPTSAPTPAPAEDKPKVETTEDLDDI